MHPETGLPSGNSRRRGDTDRAAQSKQPIAGWQWAGIAPQIFYLAAADAAIQPIIINTHPDLTVKLFSLDDQAERWTIFLKLSEAVHDSLVSGVRLVDTGGMEWLAGHVDSDGELSADWPHHESPRQRLDHYALRLE